ncbi:Acetyl-CoA synthetase [hydrothermal vent metagenome]|uniref:acetate--CoA ligase n=1 Tax=hydrothermal vent metagenome TaxID=652676 RepID=A0A3B1A5B8_9ZZZZ
MSDSKVYEIPKEFIKNTLITSEQYESMYQQSIENPDAFWSEQANKFLSWDKKWETVQDWNYSTGNIKWFDGAQLNSCYNCVDRHLKTRADQVAIIWESDDPQKSEEITYSQLHTRVSQFANVLKKRNVKKGDRVCIYMPMIPQAAYAMLACARIGAVHSVVFGGFSPESIKDRILDSDCKIVITADEGIRGGKSIPLKMNTDIAVTQCPNVHTVLVIQHTKGKINWNEKHDVWYHEQVKTVSDKCPVEIMDAEDPLFILYTSGSTGKPKGVLHTTAGYHLFAAITHKYVFDHHDDDIYWCTADVGWITGHSYILYGPLANGATTLMFEGIPSYPDASRFWQVCDKHKVTVFYTAPTAIRALMREGDSYVENTSRSSLRLLGTVGEPINPEAWEWYYHLIGNSKCPIVDTWWQTETGGHLITPLPGATKMKPGSATKPFFGIVPGIVDNDGKLLDGQCEGNLVITQSWPGQMRSIYGDHQRFIDTYFSTYPGMYFTGDGAKRDANGDYWITGRVDDVLNISGHRMGTAEVESALVKHQSVAEAAVVGYPHDIKGQGIYAYVTLIKGIDSNDKLLSELINQVRHEIGPIAKPDIIQWAPALPKTRSGKIMRRILRKIACNEINTLGDTSTLADPSVVSDLIDNRKNK